MKFQIPELDTRAASERGVVYAVKALDGVTPIKNADGNPLTVVVLGRDSTAYAGVSHRLNQARLSKMAAGGTVTNTVEEAAASTREVLVACTIGWAGFLDVDGNPVPFSKEAVGALYDQFPAIRDQVDIFIGSRANFLGGSATS